jgi:predicted membrane metal-binding protein
MSTEQPTLMQKLEREVRPWVAWLIVGILFAILAVLTGFAFWVDRDAGIGFLVTAFGLLITLLTRKSSSYVPWLFSLLFSVGGLLLVLLSLPKLAG